MEKSPRPKRPSHQSSTLGKSTYIHKYIHTYLSPCPALPCHAMHACIHTYRVSAICAGFYFWGPKLSAVRERPKLPFAQLKMWLLLLMFQPLHSCLVHNKFKRTSYKLCRPRHVLVDILDILHRALAGHRSCWFHSFWPCGSKPLCA